MYKEIDEAPGYSIYDDGRVMQTCKDCIHFEVCCYVDMFLPICDSFKDKSKFIELPCSIDKNQSLQEYMNNLNSISYEDLEIALKQIDKVLNTKFGIFEVTS